MASNLRPHLWFCGRWLNIHPRKWISRICGPSAFIHSVDRLILYRTELLLWVLIMLSLWTALEQQITPWAPDSSASACPICTTSFHPLTNRKHHCRLCGTLVCSLPPKLPRRPQTCSILFISDLLTGKIEEIAPGEVVDYGVTRKSSTPNGDRIAEDKEREKTEKWLKAVRICRNCRGVLKKRQYSIERSLVPPFERLYSVNPTLKAPLRDLVANHPPSLTDATRTRARHRRTFTGVSRTRHQSAVRALTPPARIPTHAFHARTSEAPALRQASSSRKRLLEDFANYDAIAKRIRTLQCVPGSSQDRVQTAILNRANLFLQRNMFPLQVRASNPSIGVD